MATMQESVEAALRLSNMMRDFGIVAEKLQEIGILDNHANELAASIESRRTAIGKAVDDIAQAELRAATIIAEAESRASGITTAAESSAADIIVAANKKADEICGGAVSKKDSAVAEAEAAEDLLAETSQKLAARQAELAEVETRLAKARESAAAILQG